MLGAPQRCGCQNRSNGRSGVCVREISFASLSRFSMITHDRLPTPLLLDKNSKRPHNIRNFLQEALQILRHADQTFASQDPDDEDNSDADADAENDADGAVSWKLKLSPTMMTLDTNIQTITGLEKVLQQLSVNVQPRSPKIRPPKSIAPDQYETPGFLYSIATALHLSSIFPVPKNDLFRQFNSIQLMRECVRAYVACDGALFHDIPSFLTDTEMVLSHPNASKQYPMQTLLVLCICCLMIRHVSTHNRNHPTVAASLMHAYYAHARLLLQDLFDVRHIYVVQSLFILSLYPHGHIDMFSPARTRSSLLSMATRLALAMDLHQLDAKGNGDDSGEKERIRRLMWMILCADYFAEWNASGKSGRINVAEWHVNFPQPLPNEENSRRVEYLSQYCRIVMIRKMHLFRSAYHIVMQSPKALENATDEMLFETYMGTPASFHLKLEAFREKQWSKADIEPLLLYSLYYDTLISTHISFLPEHFLSIFEDDRPTREACATDIFQRVASNSVIPLKPMPDFGSYAVPNTKDAKPALRPDIEFHCVVGCITAASHYTLILELLASLDPIGCRHNPVYGVLLTSHLYHMIEINCNDADVQFLCRINLVRTQRLLQHARNMFADPAILYLEQVLPRWIYAPMNDPIQQLQSKASDIAQALKERTKYCVQGGRK